MISVDVPFKTLKHVIHLADIHIRLMHRHKEYEQVFNRLYDQIRNENLNDFVIVLAGDIVHAKVDMSPELIEVTSTFLKNIADIAPTILIAGNHDCNLSNTNRMDALTPIANSLQHKNLYYVKDTDVIQVADTAFAVCSIFQDPTEWIDVTTITEAKNKIALYHGPVDGAQTSGNFMLSNGRVTLEAFDGYDIVMLGDIHNHQIMKYHKPLVVYAGSLIQQNFGESLTGHGYCLWDMDDHTFIFREVKNDYGYVTIEEKAGVLHHPPIFPKYTRARLFTESLNAANVNKIISTLKSQFNIIEMNINKNRDIANAPKIGATQLTGKLDVSNVAVQNSLIIDWLKNENPAIEQSMLDNIEELNRQINTQISHEDFSRNIRWRPLKLKFSNMFSYGEDNEINFDSLKGLYGIFAPNASGKSSTADSLMFCLYDKTPRAFKGEDILNNSKDSFECELLFEINSEVFGIRRTGTRKKNGTVSVSVEFWKDTDMGIELLNGIDRRSTNAIIRSYIGTYEDFIMTVMSSQYSNSMFIDTSHSERKDLLIRFIGVDIFDKLHEVANESMKEMSGVLKRFKKEDTAGQLVETADVIRQLVDGRALIEKQLSDIQTTIEKYENDIKSYESSKAQVPQQLPPLDDLNRKLEELVKGKKHIYDALESGNEKLENIEVMLGETNRQLMMESAFIPDKLAILKQAYEEMGPLEKDISKLKNEESQLLLIIANKVQHKEHLKSHKYNSDCNVCMETYADIAVQLMGTTADISELSTKLADVQDRLEELRVLHIKTQVKYNKYKRILELFSQEEVSKKTREKLIVEVQLAELKLQNITDEIVKVTNDISVHAAHKFIYSLNESFDKKIIDVHKSIKQEREQIAGLMSELKTIDTQIGSLSNKKQTLLDKIKEVEQLEVTHNMYSLYMNAIGRNGIPYDIISKVVPNIEAEINSILSQIVTFTVSLEMDGTNINSKLNYDLDRIWRLENSSGMERFISGLAIRIALINACNLPKPNFIIIDEGFGTLDADNLQSMQTLFNLLKTQFDFILIISHLDNAKDMVDNIIELKKRNGYSHITV